MSTTQAKQPSLDAPASEWLVYADALQEARDPLGELIVLNHDVASGKTPAGDRDAFVEKNIEALIGKGAKASSYRLKWRWCFIDHADVVVSSEQSANAAKLVEDLVAAKTATHLRSVGLVGVASGGTAKVDLAPAMAKLVEALPNLKTCRKVSLVDDRAEKTTMLSSRDFEPGQNNVTLGPIEPFWKIPTLDELHVCVADGEQVQFGVINAPTLKSFVFHNLRWGCEPYGDGVATLSTQLASAVWPKLENLELRLTETFMTNVIDDAGSYDPCYADNEDWEERMDEADSEGENEGTNWSEIAGVLNSVKKSPLKRLALTSFDSASTLLETIATTGLPGTLEELDLSDSRVYEVDWFLNNKEIIAPLKRLILERTAMKDDDAKRLATLGPEIKHTHANGTRYRYIVGSE